MDLPTGFMLKSEDFQNSNSLQPLLSKVGVIFTHFWLFGFSVHVLVPHAHELTRTGCTHDNYPVCGTHSIVQWQDKGERATAYMKCTVLQLRRSTYIG